MGGGRGIPTLISTAAIVIIGRTQTKAKTIVGKSNFFILLSPILIKELPFKSTKRLRVTTHIQPSILSILRNPTPSDFVTLHSI